MGSTSRTPREVRRIAKTTHQAAIRIFGRGRRASAEITVRLECGFGQRDLGALIDNWETPVDFRAPGTANGDAFSSPFLSPLVAENQAEHAHIAQTPHARKQPAAGIYYFSSLIAP